MSVTVTSEQMSLLRDTLLNTSGDVALHERFRALFMLKAVGTDETVKIIADGTLCAVLSLRAKSSRHRAPSWSRRPCPEHAMIWSVILMC